MFLFIPKLQTPFARHLHNAGIFVSAVHSKLIRDYRNNTIRRVKRDKAKLHGLLQCKLLKSAIYSGNSIITPLLYPLKAVATIPAHLVIFSNRHRGLHGLNLVVVVMPPAQNFAVHKSHLIAVFLQKLRLVPLDFLLIIFSQKYIFPCV